MRQAHTTLEYEQSGRIGVPFSVVIVVLAGLSSASCAHTDDSDRAARDAERREVDLLRERVARLERQASDTHTKLDRVLAKLDEREGQGSAADARKPSRPKTESDAPRPEHAPSSPAILHSQSVDISRAPASHERDDMGESGASSDGAPSDSDSVPRAAFDGNPIVIDADALRRFDATRAAPASETRPPTTRAPPRPEPKTPRQSKGQSKEGRETPSASGSSPSSAPHAKKTPSTLVVDGLNENPKIVYKRAMQHFEAGRCDLAEQGFTSILTRAPDHDLADNALYWTGVCRQRAARLEEAAQLFAEVPLRYPNSNKLADALFSLAEVHEAQGDVATAQMYYLELTTRFPDTERASEASKALGRQKKR